MKLKEFEKWFREKLMLDDFLGADNSMNGMQAARKNEELHTAAFAVDASMETFRRASDAGADVLVVHHGLFWGKPLAVVGSHHQRLSWLLSHDLALFAAHLPLDAHPELGNNAGIAEALDLREVKPFGAYHGVMIGCRGVLPDAVTPLELLSRLGWDEQEAAVLPFGPEKLLRGGIISGGAADGVHEAVDEELDFFITGEVSHQVYHYCLESGITMIAGGHYLTEVYGVRRLAEAVGRETGISTVFIDIPTGL